MSDAVRETAARLGLQDAGYKQAVEKWDTVDSDSDESDEEDLKQ